jgi:hypothetical protein
MGIYFPKKYLICGIFLPSTYYPEISSRVEPLYLHQIRFEIAGIDNSAKEPLGGCRMKAVVLTLDTGNSDLEVREQEGVTGLRRRPERIASEAFRQGGLLTVEDIVSRLLNCGEQTVVRDIKALKERGVCLPLRSTIRDMGRSLSHREMIVRHWLPGMEFSKISHSAGHSIEVIASYAKKFKRVVCLAKDNHEIGTIAFLVKISVSLAQQYYELYQTLDIVACREKELDELIKKR